MRLTAWRPFQEIDDVFQRHAALPDIGWPSFSNNGNTALEWAPSADISESKEEYLVEAQLPGVEKDDIKVNIVDNVLTISGERKQREESDDEKYHKVESFYGSFTRSFSLPSDVDAAELQADCSNGVLRVHLPKTEVEDKTARTIPIN